MTCPYCTERDGFTVPMTIEDDGGGHCPMCEARFDPSGDWYWVPV
jgi:uncharacterized Zn-finger protein